MTKFVSNTRNPYEKSKEKKHSVNGQFISGSKAGTIHMFQNISVWYILKSIWL